MNIGILIFIISWILLFISSKWLVKGVSDMAKFLGWREFIISFFVVAVVGSVPNLFVGIISALHKIPQLSLGDIIGGNLIDLTLVVSLAALFAKNGLPAKSKTVQTSAIFTMIIAILPVVLISDGILGRIDGIILFLFFAFYIIWVFSKKERFSLKKDEEGKEEKINDLENLHPSLEFIDTLRKFTRSTAKTIVGSILMAISASGIVNSSIQIIHSFNIYPIIFGTLIVSLGNCLPDIFFSVSAAKEDDTWETLGDLMGSVMVTGTLVLGIVAIIYPITLPAVSYFLIARIFLIVASLFFLFFIRTERTITKKEAAILLFTYIVFILIVIFS